ncbi:RFA1 [[Candida] subhashii]|uniref:Replication protein A subunit n=1 Tax=[Candida] subhashii TaxID=561895 RepID=A0A8J5UMP6_9ASCO|nr:RFA1 [[Candida] subhashii]KAG7663421.1 RFA1 [[Candida] subhashii]
MTVQLSRGTLKDIFSISGRNNVRTPFVLQVNNIKPVAVAGDVKKYRILVNDGVYSCHGLIDETCVPYLENNGFARYSILQVNDYSVFATQKHIILVKQCELLTQTSDKPGELIAIDTYYANNPDDDSLGVSKKSATGEQFARSESPVATPPVQQQQPQQNAYSNTYGAQQHTPAQPDGAPARRVTPIETLSPYQNNWTIKARVSYKGDLRTWSNAKGEGKLFSVNLLDESDEIKATAFNETAERGFKLLEEGKVYYISKAKVQGAKKKFNHLTHPYELTLDRDTEIVECFDTSNVPKLHFNFVKLDQIQNLEPNAIVDVIGALKHVNEAFQIIAKSTGKAFDRRNITIVDESGFAIEVGLWNTTAVDFNIPEGSVIAFKGCKVQDFNGRSLTLSQSGSLIPNPETPEAYQLKGWYDNQGINESFKSLKVESSSGSANLFESRKLISQAQDENLGKSEKPDYFSIKATISFTKHETFSYPACPNIVQPAAAAAGGTQVQRPPQPCNRKLIEQSSDGTWRCERCDMNYAEPTHRYIFNCAVMDTSGQIWITLFDAEARKLFGMDAGELMKLREASLDDPSNTEFIDKINSITFKEYNFRIRARQDTYNDTLRVRYQAVGIDPVDYNAEAEHLCKELEQLMG